MQNTDIRQTSAYKDVDVGALKLKSFDHFLSMNLEDATFCTVERCK